jgi:hypothetical protein
MDNKPQIFKYTCNRLVNARYVATHRMNRNGWVLIKNKSTFDTVHVSINEGDRIYATIRPLHAKPIQFDNGTVISISSTVIGTALLVEESIYKPEVDTYWTDEDSVENIPYCAPGVAISTVYNCTTLGKGYATYVQIIADNGTGFIGTIEISSNNGTTYSSAIPILESDPNKRSWEENRVVTNIRVTRTAGTFTVYYR